jgi:hypothetical protein
MPVNGGPRRAEVKRPDTYRTVPRQTTFRAELAVADEQLESPVELLMAASRKAKTHDRCRNALASIKTIRDAVLTESSSPPAS